MIPAGEPKAQDPESSLYFAFLATNIIMKESSATGRHAQVKRGGRPEIFAFKTIRA
jgi:hypothetical protein